MRFPLFLLFSLVLLVARSQERDLMRIQRSQVTFTSDAPLEHITATNGRATGILDREARTFAVQIPMAEFQGFNSPLQREHFNENYMLSRKWPNATFSGRIIEGVDLSMPGEHAVRAKGDLTIKGVTRERIISCRLVVAEEGVGVTTTFDVLLDEHDIRVPKVVQQKISSVVQVELELLFRNAATPQ